MKDARCDKCGRVLAPVFPDRNRRHGDDQYNDVLHIFIDGGYGEYYDTCDHGPYHLRLCKDCADALWEHLPKLEGA